MMKAIQNTALPVILDTSTLQTILKVPAGSWSLRQAQGRVPQPSGYLNRVPYWLKTDVDNWLATRASNAPQKSEG